MRILVLSIITVVFSISGIANVMAAGSQQRLDKSAPASSDFFPQNNQITAISTVRVLNAQLRIDHFRIVIPRIGVGKDIQANVDPSKRDVYLPVIEKVVAHGKYTRLPYQATKEGNVYLFAHRDGSHGFFHRLGELRNGDVINIEFNESTYVYEVYKSFVVDPSDVWVYTGESEVPALTLQTCENGNAQRLIVKAKLVQIK